MIGDDMAEASGSWAEVDDVASARAKLGRACARANAAVVRAETAMRTGKLRTPISTKVVRLNPRVLLVDDDPAVARASKRSLERAGCTVVVAHDGLTAANLLSEQWDAVVADIDLGLDVSGASVLMRAQRDCPRAVRIAWSGHVDSDQMLELERSGVAHRSLHKAIPGSELAAAVRGLLEGKRTP